MAIQDCSGLVPKTPATKHLLPIPMRQAPQTLGYGVSGKMMIVGSANDYIRM